MSNKSFKDYMSNGMSPQVIAIIQMTQAISELSILVQSVIKSMEEIDPNFKELFDSHMVTLTEKANEKMKQAVVNAKNEYPHVIDNEDEVEQYIKELINKIKNGDIIKFKDNTSNPSDDVFDELLKNVDNKKLN